MGTRNLDKFELLMWKNFLLLTSNKSQLIIELLLPLIFSLLLVGVRTLVIPISQGVTIYDLPQPIDLFLLRTTMINVTYQNRVKVQYNLAYSPENEILDRIIERTADKLGITYTAHLNSQDLEAIVAEKFYLAGVDFGDSMASIATYPNQLSYTLRFPGELRTSLPKTIETWLTNLRFVLDDRLGPRNDGDVDGGIPAGYLREGFLAVQHEIATAFIEESGKNNNQELPKVYMQRFPYPPYIDDPLMDGMGAMMPLLIILSFIYPCTYTVKYVTAEKEKQLKEIMKIMGIQNWLHWTAWFGQSFVLMAITSLLITFVLTTNWTHDVAVFTYSSFTAVYFFMLIYVVTSICLCFMLSTFFSKASTAATLTAVVWFVTYIPYSYVFVNYDHLSFATKMGWSLISNTAMGMGLRWVVRAEAAGQGFHWDNMFTNWHPDDPITMGSIILMMLLSCCIYLAICLYTEQVFPGQYGVPKKWYFPLTKSFWVGERVLADEHSERKIKRQDQSSFERAPQGLQIGVQVVNLCKKFGSRKVVKKLNINMYQGEITVLLGHNGAGKTTTISMLTGMFPPTSGTAIINGYDIRKNIEGARMSLGICPQHNILFDALTVRHHITFFSRMKGLSGDALNDEVEKYLKMINIGEKADVEVSSLSGGMKRKVSVCVAFCGGTKVVLCDEPSSGMDPAARRQMWDLLGSEKTGRTVLLTTHFMDEAEVLGDRIAIMSDGELKCYGTTFFLKKRFASGYHLICVKKSDCDSSKVTEVLQKYLPGIKPEADIGSELSYLLPDNFSSKFESIFQDLESNSEVLRIDGYGVSVTSLEEVFTKVGSDKIEASTSNLKKNDAESERKRAQSVENMFSHKPVLSKGLSLILSQWYAMFYKKYVNTLRSKMTLSIQNTMPIVFIAFTISVAARSSFPDLEPILLTVPHYKRSVTVLETTSNVEDGSLEAKIAENYKKIANTYGRNHKFVETGRSFIDYILSLGKRDQFHVEERYLAAATVDRGQIIAWLNNKPLHSAPLSLNLVHNAMAKAIIGDNAGINVINDPLPFRKGSMFYFIRNSWDAGLQLAINFGFCMCLISSFYIMFPIREEQIRNKLLQFIGGVTVVTFWVSHYVWDMLTFSITAMVAILTFAYYQEAGFSTFDELTRHMVIILLFGYAVLPFTYLASKHFDDPATGYAKISVLNIFCGVALFIILGIIRYPEFGAKAEADFLEKFCLAYPHFALTQGIAKLYYNSRIRVNCDKLEQITRKDLVCKYARECCVRVSFFEWRNPGVRREVIYLLLTGSGLFAYLIASEYGIIDTICRKIRSKWTKPISIPDDKFSDEDVEDEEDRVCDMTNSEIAENNLVLDDLTKLYGQFLAVNRISVAISHSECFGLLGVNGAGKTTTFKMLTGDEKITSGDAYVTGVSVKNDLHKAYKEIGYCPQFDALLDSFTGRETLKVFCLLRGIPVRKIPKITMDLAKLFGFKRHIDKKIRDCSGGNKRKVSTAVAVLASPSVVLLDEPTSGMDPVARRSLWNVVCMIRDAGTTIVLTSHSMEECEALCTCIAIMVNGEFMCIGPTQHLKNKFTKGLILKVKMGADTPDKDVEAVINFISKEFPAAVLQERYLGILTFHIPVTNILWSKMFGLIENNKQALKINDYSITQTTLEEIFLEFSLYQSDDARKIPIDDNDDNENDFSKKWKDWLKRLRRRSEE